MNQSTKFSSLANFDGSKIFATSWSWRWRSRCPVRSKNFTLHSIWQKKICEYRSTSSYCRSKPWGSLMNASAFVFFFSKRIFDSCLQNPTIAHIRYACQRPKRDFGFWVSVIFACAALLPSKKCGARAQLASTDSAFFSAGRSPLDNTIRISLSNAFLFSLGAVGVWCRLRSYSSCRCPTRWRQSRRPRSWSSSGQDAPSHIAGWLPRPRLSVLAWSDWPW